MDLRSDDELMELVKKNDERAFEVLYRRHADAVYGYCMRLFSGNRSQVDDTCQETWCKVVRRADTYVAPSNFKGWVMRIARNEAMDLFRKRHPDLSLSEESAPEVPDDFDLEDSLADAFGAQELRAAIDTLPEGQRAVFVLWAEEEASYAEIGRKLNLEFNSVRALLYRARQNLRAKLEKK